LGGIIRRQALAGVQTYILRFAFWLTVVLGVLALVLTVSGLFSILSYVIEQRSKEIGVRMALGATAGHVVRLMLSQSLRPVGIGIVAGGGLAAILAMVVTSAASEIASVVHALDPVAYAASGIVITAVCLLGASVPALRAARIDPIATIRKD
jgi:ABC-type antimicrobial peptide transport system permease subunit